MEVANLTKALQADIDAIGSIGAVPSILEVVCKTTGMGFSAVARVTDDKWIACAVRDEISFGLQPGGELTLETTICNEIRQTHEPVIIDHVEKDPIFCSHHTPAMYGFQSYISIPIIRKDGSFFGTLCAIDPKPAKLKNAKTIGMFKLFAELISFHLDAIDQLAISEAKLLEERKIADLREQFIAILGHDLKNPVSAVMMGAQLLQQFPLDEEMKEIAGTIKNSSYRMSGLIENILDFARGRMGGGIQIIYKINASLDKTLNQVVKELRTIYPNRKIETNFYLDKAVNCDSNRIGQLFSNLLANAIVHGDKDSVVEVNAFTAEEQFCLTVTNYGNSIPAATMQRLFQPFYRGDDRSGKKGLGLGLYIASEIAKAHQGELSVDSTEINTCFTLQIPL